MPAGGGYTAELLLGDADAALAALVDSSPDGKVTVIGRGLGAYIALQVAGARATQVHGAFMLDGPGLAGGPTGPTSQSFFTLPPTENAPDPYALVELGRDLRPPDYVRSFVQLAIAGSDVDEDQSRYLDHIAAAVREVQARRDIFPICFGSEMLDRYACEALSERLDGVPVIVSDDYDMFEMVSVLRASAAVVSSRYHAIVTSMPGLVPSAGITMDERIRNLILYRAAISRPQAQRSEVMRTVKRAFDGAMTPMMQFLIEGNDLSEDELRELERLLKKKRNK